MDAGTPCRTADGAAIVVRDLTKRYGRLAALSRVGFAVAPGEAVALWGPNGAGKTTVLRCLLGLARYDGEVRVCGIDPAKDGRAARRRIGYVPQDLPVSPLSVGEFARFVARLKRVPAEDAAASLDRLGIGDQVDKPVAALSGGLKQRLSLALALIGAPSVLLLDEPTANLDARGRAELLRLLRGLKSDGITFVYSSHRPQDVLALADRVLLLDAGELRGTATPPGFLADLGGTSRLTLLLENGRRQEAVDTLARLGLAADAEGHVVTVAVPARRQADVIVALVGAGIEIGDFDLERGPWTDRA